MFESKSIPKHLVRGAIGVGAFAVATWLGPRHPELSLGAIVVALLALRGCPMCWTIGLAQTVIARARGKPTTGLCVDGSCSLADTSAPDAAQLLVQGHSPVRPKSLTPRSPQSYVDEGLPLSRAQRRA